MIGEFPLMGQDGVQAGKVKCGSTVPDANDICWLASSFYFDLELD